MVAGGLGAAPALSRILKSVMGRVQRLVFPLSEVLSMHAYPDGEPHR